MLSGIGPKDHLKTHEIECVNDVPIGQNLRDHINVAIYLQPNESVLAKAWIPTEVNIKSARQQFLKDGTGPFAYINSCIAMGYIRDDSYLQLNEFVHLPAEEKRHMRRDTVPHAEIVFAPLATPWFPESFLLSLQNVIMNPQSSGTVKLASSNPIDSPICDPAFLTHQFDRATIIKDIRRLLSFMKVPGIAKLIDKPIIVPKSDSDEDIMEFIKQTANTTWHMCCTVKMGKVDDPTTCVDSNFKIKGLEKIRVVDLSVTPFVPNCHTVSIAYWLGELAAEKILKEYNLNE